MREGLKVELEKVRSAERRLKELMAQFEDQASRWNDRAEQAYALGEDDLAREALAHRSKCLHHRQEFLTQLSQAEMLRNQLEKEFDKAVKEDAKNTVIRVAEEIKAVQQELQQARMEENALLASVLEEKIEALLSLGRQAWRDAFPEEAVSYQNPPWEQNIGSFNSPFVDPYSAEIDAELENLKRRLDRL